MEKRNPKAAAAYPELLAQHFSEGGLFDRAADYWLLAGTRAGNTWAKVEAAELFRKGIEAARRMPASSARDRRILRLELERSEEHTSELQSLMRISYAVFCLKKKKK